MFEFIHCLFRKLRHLGRHKQNHAVSLKHTHYPLKVTTISVCLCALDAGSVPVLALESVGVGPVELERGGIFVLLLLLAFGFFSILRPNSGERASELFSIKRGKRGEQRVVANAGQATKALIHFCQTRRPHYGDILTTNKPKKTETQSKCLSKKRCVLTQKNKCPKSGASPLTKRRFSLAWEVLRPTRR